MLFINTDFINYGMVYRTFINYNKYSTVNEIFKNNDIKQIQLTNFEYILNDVNETNELFKYIKINKITLFEYDFVLFVFNNLLLINMNNDFLIYFYNITRYDTIMKDNIELVNSIQCFIINDPIDFDVEIYNLFSIRMNKYIYNVHPGLEYLRKFKRVFIYGLEEIELEEIEKCKNSYPNVILYINNLCKLLKKKIEL